MEFLQQFHLIFKYKKGITNNLEDMILRPFTSNMTILGTLMQIQYFINDACKEAYKKGDEFTYVFQQLQGQNHVEEGDGKGDYHPHDGLLKRPTPTKF
jgi:hypothetical protein